MQLTQIRGEDCADGRTCPGVHQAFGSSSYMVIGRPARDPGPSSAVIGDGPMFVDLPARYLPEVPASYHRPDGTIRIGGQPVTDLDALSQLPIDDGEAAVEISAALLPALQPMLSEQQLGELLDQAEFELYRQERLTEFDVTTDGDDFRRYVNGADGPDPARKAPTLQRLRDDKLRGLDNLRVRVFRSPPGPYLRYEFEWGYAPNAAAGENIRVLDLAEMEEPEGLVEEEFWLMDRRIAITMHYDARGRFLGATIVPDGQLSDYLDARDAAWSAARPFNEYWAAHPQFRRAA